LRRAALAAVALLGACGGGVDPAPVGGSFDVVLVTAEGEPVEHEETWDLDCDDDACTLRRDAGGALGDATELRLARVGGGGYSGEARTGCTDVEVELDIDGDVVVGSVALGGCEDLTLGFSGSRAG